MCDWARAGKVTQIKSRHFIGIELGIFCYGFPDQQEVKTNDVGHLVLYFSRSIIS